MGLRARIRDVVRRHRPDGWRIRERPALHGCDGQAEPCRRTIFCLPLIDTDALFVFLHETAHVRFGHVYPGRATVEDLDSTWLQEFEAEDYAIRTMRAEGFTVSRDNAQRARRYVRDHFLLRHDPSDLDTPLAHRALRFAFQAKWREHLL